MQETRKATINILLIVIPLGFYTKFYSGPASVWVNDSLGGVFYEIFWILLVFLFFPRIKGAKIASVVFIATSVLEFLQLWHPAFLEYIRSFFIGRTILGNAFNPYDFLYYIIGSVTGYFIILYISRKQNSSVQK